MIKDHFPKRILEELGKDEDGEVIVCTDVGQHQMWTAQYYPFKTHDYFVTSGGLGTMGFGLGASIGAKVSSPKKRVYHITGDGSLRMNLNEMATTVRHKLPIITILMDNCTLGMVRQWQSMFYDKRYAETCLPQMNFTAIAEGFGYKTYKANNIEEFKTAINDAKKQIIPTLIHCKIDIDELVLPMVAPGAAISEIMMTRT